MKRRPFDIAVIRRREIERHARYIGAAETEDFWRWPVAWCWHNTQSKDPVHALIGAVTRMGGTYSAVEAEDVLQRAGEMYQRRKARPLGKFLGVTYEHRRICGIRTFGPTTPPALRREQNRMTQEMRRRAKGAQSREEYENNSLSRRKPWKAENISRRTWERRRKRGQAVASPSAIIPTLKVDASPSAIIYLLNTDAPASFEPSQAAVRANAQPCGYGKHFTKRWIAARTKACGLRHNRWRMTDPRRGRGATAHRLWPRLRFSQS
jgi:hypothetical protein